MEVLPDITRLKSDFDKTAILVQKVEQCEFLKASEKAAKIEEIRRQHDKTVELKRNFVMTDVDNNIALRRLIYSDAKRPGGLSPSRIWDVVTLIYMFSDKNGKVKLSKKELAAEAGLTMDNMWKTLKYLRVLGVIAADQSGAVPMDGKFSEKAKNLYYASDDSIYINPHFCLKRAHPRVKELREQAKAAAAATPQKSSDKRLTGDLFQSERPLQRSADEIAERNAFLASLCPDGVISAVQKNGAQQPASR